MRAKDTDAAAEAVQLELLRRATVAERFALVRSLSRSVIELSRRAVRRRVADEKEAMLTSVGLEYGGELEGQLRAHLEKCEP